MYNVEIEFGKSVNSNYVLVYFGFLVMIECCWNMHMAVERNILFCWLLCAQTKRTMHNFDQFYRTYELKRTCTLFRIKPCYCRSFEKSLDEGLSDTLRSGKGLSGRENILRLVLKQHEDEYTDLRTFT